MLPGVFSIQPAVRSASRLPALANADSRVTAMEIGLLLTAGIAAGLAATTLDFNLRIPGHAILRAIFPMALGIALVPRRLGGMVMGGSALGTALLMRAFDLSGIGVGAMTSLCLTGPLLDAALWWTRVGWRLYVSFILAGLSSNLVAFLVRGSFKMGGGGGGGGGRLAEAWLLPAIVTYPLCGIVAGLISAAVWFQFRERPPEQQP